jgi:tryptophanyl-tRNA synthetase
MGSKYLSGIRPSGKLHLGNYIGSILPALKYGADVLIAEYHSPEGNANDLYSQLVKYFDNSKIIYQSQKFDAKTYFELLSVTPTGLLKHMPQYKEKEKNALMFTYPVLMAHDLVGYDYVIVGDDQRPHIEFAKDILTKCNYRCPEPIYEGGRVMDLRHPKNKMSKSNLESCLFLEDGAKVIRKKIGKAVTNEVGLRNLQFIYKQLHGIESHHTSNAELKEAIATKLIETL